MNTALLKKASVGMGIFLLFAAAGIGAAEVTHRASQSDQNALETQQEESATEGAVVAPVVSASAKADSSKEKKAAPQPVRSVSPTQEVQATQATQVTSRGDWGDDANENEDEDEGDDDSRGTVQTGSTTTAPAQTTSSTPSATFTMAQVSTHSSAASCYTAVSGTVYNLTPFINQHPGGASAVLSLCGIDGTASFNAQHGGQSRPANELAGLEIGTLI